jgi:hypothetical protein
MATFGGGGLFHGFRDFFHGCFYRLDGAGFDGGFFGGRDRFFHFRFHHQCPIVENQFSPENGLRIGQMAIKSNLYFFCGGYR